MDELTKENLNQENQSENLLDAYKEAKKTEEPEIILPFEVKDGEEYNVESLGKIKRKPFYAFFKRLFDFTVSLIFLAVLILPFIIIAIIIKCSSKGPVFYCQERLGKNGKPFKLIKFRTMVVDAEKDGAKWSDGDNDERIYKFGRFMRKCRIDELPQLFCCLTGKMSIVGPRPERGCFYEEFEKYIHGFSERLKVKPGITGLAQVKGGYDLKPQEKVLFDVEYIKKRSIWLDIKIMFKTVAVVFSHDGAK
jgi:lipopolysaccharide/colanic/teichoic acid biosynthesis glycosyltransferase